MNGAYEKIIALMRNQGKSVIREGAFIAKITAVKPRPVIEIMGQVVDDFALAPALKLTEEDEGGRLLCIAADSALVALTKMGV